MKSPQSWGSALGGAGAIAGGVMRLALATVYAVTGLGSAGDLPFGAFSRFTFLPPCALVLAPLGLLAASGGVLGRAGKLGLIAATCGLTLTVVGKFGGEWLAFPRSGNYLNLPGVILVMLGMISYAITARRIGRRTQHWTLALSIGVFPIAFLAVAGVGLGLAGGTFPPMMPDNYFRASYAVVGVLWVLLGWSIWRSAPVSWTVHGSA